MSRWQREEMHGMSCRVLLPEPYDPRRRHPLVVWLHGSGERGDDNEAQLKNGITAFEHELRAFNAIVVAPQAKKSDTFGGSWYGGESATQRAVVAMTRELAARQSVDEARVYLVGFSMGAIGGWDILARHRDLFTAAVLIAGDLDVNQAMTVTTPVWAVHGERDELVSNRNVREIASRVDVRVKYTELRDAGHDVWKQTFAHRPLWDWLFASRRSS